MDPKLAYKGVRDAAAAAAIRHWILTLARKPNQKNPAGFRR